MSQLLLRLDELLRVATDPVLRAELQVRRACYLARIGRFEEVESIIAGVRRAYGDGTHARISCWLMLAEGITENFKNMSPRAKDRIARAQLISVAIKEPTLAAVTSAWKAHIDFETSDFKSMAVALRTAFAFASQEDHDAHSRIAMVISDCMFLYGDRAGAQQWFMKSRSHAVHAGDQATIDALLYNRAAFGMACLRAERCFVPQDPKLVALVKLEIASAKNFQEMTRTSALTNFVHLCEARVFMLSDDYKAALEALRAVRSMGPFAEYNFSDELIDLDIVFCMNQLGMIDDAVRAFSALRDSTFSKYDIDDRLVAFWMLKEMSIKDDRFGSHEVIKNEFSTIQEIYRSSREAIRVAVAHSLAGQ
jgi:hypothetical protein